MSRTDRIGRRARAISVPVGSVRGGVRGRVHVVDAPGPENTRQLTTFAPLCFLTTPPLRVRVVKKQSVKSDGGRYLRGLERITTRNRNQVVDQQGRKSKKTKLQTAKVSTVSPSGSTIRDDRVGAGAVRALAAAVHGGGRS